jgi:hypothetical protein
MIRDTDKAVKTRLLGITDKNNQSCRVVWGHGSEHNTASGVITPVENLRQTQISITRLDFPIDDTRTRARAEVKKKMLVNGKWVLRTMPFVEPKNVLYQIEIRVEGEDAQDRMRFVARKVNRIFRHQSYMMVPVDLFGDGEIEQRPALILLNSSQETAPQEVGRREFTHVFTYTISSAIVHREDMVDKTLVTEVDVAVTTESTEGPSTETIVVTR